MKYGILIRYVAIVVVGVFAVGILLDGGTPEASWLSFFSVAVIVASAGLLAWDHLLWRLPIVQRLPRVPRSARGTWKGKLTSQWLDPETKKVIDPKLAYLVIRQSASMIDIVLLTDESRSRSSLGVVTEASGQWSLDYMYLNKPKMSIEHRSRMHHGSTSLEMIGSPVAKLDGRYWTDRDSKGELRFDQHSSVLAGDYDSAAALFSKG